MIRVHLCCFLEHYKPLFHKFTGEPAEVWRDVMDRLPDKGIVSITRNEDKPDHFVIICTPNGV